MAKYTTITVRIPLELKQRVVAECKADERSLTKFVERALRAAVEQGKRGQA